VQKFHRLAALGAMATLTVALAACGSSGMTSSGAATAAPTVAPANANANQIVLEVGPGGKYAINSETVTRDRLPTRLKEIYDPRPEKIIFVKGSQGVKYADIIDAMDVARGSGVKVIGIPPKDTPGGPGATK